ncbi:MAG: nitroreductase family protein [Synergistaceae bacterium]|nr:nitroreductase family protein [Synergistaceae bacterium]
MELVNLRRSIRNYTDTPVSEDDLRTILEAARQAPSGENYQPWRFTVVRDQENKDFLSMVGKAGSGRRFTSELLSRHIMERFVNLKDPEKRAKAFKKLTSGDVSAFVNQADVIILISGRLDVWDAPYDTSAAIENMCLVATSLGLGTCWVGAATLDVRDERRINQYFGVPAGYKSFGMLAVGEPARYPHARPRHLLSEIVYKEKFGVPYYEKEPENKEA